MSRCTGFSEKSFFFIKSVIQAKSMGSDAITVNFWKELDSAECSMRVLGRLDFKSDVM